MRRLTTTIAALLAISTCYAIAAPPASAEPPRWIDGGFRFQNHLNCFTGNAETLITSYTGYFGSVNPQFPLVGNVYYVHVVFSIPGRPCVAGPAVSVEAILPRGTSLAIGGSNRVRCYYTSPQTGQTSEVTNDPAAACVQNPGQGSYGKTLGTRQVPTGAIFEIQYPVVSTIPLVGLSGPNGGDKHRAYLYASIASPATAFPEALAFVGAGAAGSTPSITYPNPPTNVTNTTADTPFTLTRAGTTGTLYADISTSTNFGFGQTIPPFSVGAGDPDPWTTLQVSWNQLQPGTQYYWRVRYQPSGGGEFVGATQTFTTTGSRPPPACSLSPSSNVGTAVTEGVVSAVVRYRHTCSTAGHVSRADWVLVAGSASAFADYANVSGTLSVPNMVLSGQLEIPIVDDLMIEGTETFTVHFTAANENTGAPADTTVRILDDDTAGTLLISPVHQQAPEGSTASVMVNRVGGVSGAISVVLDTASGGGPAGAAEGADFIGVHTTVNLADGQVTATVPIPVTDDTIEEGAEAFSVAISNPGGGAVLGMTTTASVAIPASDTPAPVPSPSPSAVPSPTASPLGGSGTRTRYFPEGTTRTGFVETLYLTNRAGDARTAEVEFNFADGAPTEVRSYQVSARGQAIVDVGATVGAERDVSLVVRAPGDVSAARVVTITGKQFGTLPDDIAGTTGFAGVDAPRTEWSVAEGTTLAGFQEYLTIQNPNPAAAEIDIAYGFEGSVGPTRHVSVPPRSRATVDVNAPNQAGPGQTGVSARLVATNGVTFLVERPLYFDRDFGGTGSPIEGGHVAAAASPRTNWFFAEGTVLTDWFEFLTLFNPAASPTTVTATYLLEGAGPISRSYTIAPGSRRTVQVYTDAPTEGVGRAATTAVSRGVSVRISATGAGIVAERPVYAQANQEKDAVIYDGHVAVGAIGGSTCTSFATAFLSKPSRSYLTLANPGTSPVTVDVGLIVADPAVSGLPIAVAVPAEERRTVVLHDIPSTKPTAGVEVIARDGAAVVSELPFYTQNGTTGGPGGRTILGASVLLGTDC